MKTTGPAIIAAPVVFLWNINMGLTYTEIAIKMYFSQ